MSRILIRNTFIYTVGEVVPKLISFVLLPVFTYYLSPDDYGILSYTTAVMVFLPQLSMLCLNSFVLRFFYIRESESDRKKLVGNIFLFTAVLNLLVLFLAYQFIPILLKQFHVKVPWNPYFKLALIAMFLDVFSIIPLAFYRIQHNAKAFVALSVLKIFIQYLIIVVLIVYYKKGILGYYFGSLIASIPFFIAYWVIIYKQAILNFNYREVKEGLKFSLPLLPGVLAYLVIGFSDRILLEPSVSISTIGIYNIAYTLAFSLNMIMLSVYKAIEPEIFRRYGTVSFENFINRAKSVFFFTTFCGAMGVSLFSQEFFKIIAPVEYYKGYLYVPIIMISVIMTGQNILFGGILTAQKNTKIIGVATLIGVLINILFNLFFIPLYGVFAAAISIAIAFGIINTFLYLKIKIKKSVKQEAIAFSIYLVTVITIFFIFDIKLSPGFTVFKAFIFIVYTGLLLKIFDVKLVSIWQFFKAKSSLE